MKRFILATLFAASAAAPALAADVGVSVNIGQPGFYGRIDIGNFPQPQLVFPQPVVIVPAPYAVVQQPIYLRVPPGHAKDWGKHCSRYNACGQRVYFVQDGWYQNVYAPAYRSRGDGERRYRDDDRRGGDDDRGHRGRGKDHDHQGKGKGPKHDR